MYSLRLIRSDTQSSFQNECDFQNLTKMNQSIHFMFNKYTLSFYQAEDENLFYRFTAQRALSELAVASVYGIAYMFTNLVQYSIRGYYFHSIGIGSSLIFVYVTWMLTRKNTKYIDYVVLLYQMIITMDNQIDWLLSLKMSTDAQWSKGYLCGFAHILVYLQGSNFLSHSLVLTLMNAIHIWVNFLGTESGVRFAVLFIIMQANIIAVKYYYERTKREEFVLHLQQKKWQELVSKVISDHMMLIRFDKQQDQLRLVEVSKMAARHLGVRNCADMRKFLRSLKPVKRDLRSLDSIFTIEQQVRNKMLPDSATPDKTKITGHNPATDEVYKIKLTPIVLDNQLHCLLIITFVESASKEQQSVERSLLQEVTILAKRTSINLLTFQHFRVAISKKLLLETYQAHNFFLNLQFLLELQPKRPKKIIEAYLIEKHLARLMAMERLRIEASGSQFVSDSQLVLQVLITIFHIVQHYNPNCTKVSMRQATTSTCSTFTLNFHASKLSSQVAHLLQSNWSRRAGRKFKFQKDFTMFVERVRFLQKVHEKLSPFILHQTCILQVLLAQVGEVNHLAIRQEEGLLIEVNFTNLC